MNPYLPSALPLRDLDLARLLPKVARRMQRLRSEACSIVRRAGRCFESGQTHTNHFESRNIKIVGLKRCLCTKDRTQIAEYRMLDRWVYYLRRRIIN